MKTKLSNTTAKQQQQQQQQQQQMQKKEKENDTCKNRNATRRYLVGLMLPKESFHGRRSCYLRNLKARQTICVVHPSLKEDGSLQANVVCLSLELEPFLYFLFTF